MAKHMGLIYSTMQRMKEMIPEEMPREDVMQYGCIGLMKALGRYEEGRGPLSTFACHYIYGSIVDGIFQFRGIKRRRSGAGWDRAELIVDPDSPFMLQIHQRENEAYVERMKEAIEERQSLYRALQKLKPEERELIEAYYFRQKSWEEYAKEHYVNVQWVWLMHRRILKKLRGWLCG